MAGRLPVYIVPVLLILMEWILRSALSIDAEAFVGPTLASVGIGLTVPLTRVGKADQVEHKLPQEVMESVEKLHLEVRPKREQLFIEICWVAVIVSMGLWFWTLYLSLKYPLGMVGSRPAYDYSGAAGYLLGAILTEVKERI